MHKALNVPPTPSPDSAVHSAYSVFSSPNQSPLTQRHVTLTPNLSRNNSDASHSSCCSYSSVSVSVSPTQQFSPTHSPIQVRGFNYRFTVIDCLIISENSPYINNIKLTWQVQLAWTSIIENCLQTFYYYKIGKIEMLCETSHPINIQDDYTQYLH